MVLYERKFVSLHHKTDKRTKITFKRRFCYNYKEALKMKLLIIFTSFAYYAIGCSRQNGREDFIGLY